MPLQKSPFLCAIRWALIAGLGVLLLGTGIEAAWVVLKMGLSGGDYVWLQLIPLVIFSLCVMAFLAVMLHSLLVRRLQGFASCLGAALAMTLFALGWYLPIKVHVFEQWMAAPLPFTVKALAGIPLGLGLFILPFYAANWTIPFTTRWLYPRVLQPLERRM